MLRELKIPHKENPLITHYDLLAYCLEDEAVCLKWATEDGPVEVGGKIVSTVKLPFASNTPEGVENTRVEITDTRFIFSYTIDGKEDSNYRLLSTLDNELQDLT